MKVMRLYIALIRLFVKMDAIKFRAVIFYMWRDGKKAAEIHQKLVDSDGQSAPSFKTVSYWIHQFKCGRRDVLNEKPGGQPKFVITEDLVQAVKKMVDEDGRVTITVLADTFKVSYYTAWKICTTT